MSRNGSGTYTLPAGNPVVTGTTITSSWANTTMQNIADGLTQSVSADGQTPMTGALNMANNNINTVATLSSANVYASNSMGVGTTSPSYKLDVVGSINNAFRVTDGTYSGILTPSSIGGVATGSTSNHPLIFVTNNTESSRIDASGNVCIGRTSVAIAGRNLNLSSSVGVGAAGFALVNTNAPTKLWQTGPDGSGNYLVFNDAAAGAYITYGGTSWTSSSDERLKTDLVPIEDAINKVSTLRAVTGRFKTDEEGTSRAFLIAQDVQKVLPEAVNASDPEKLGIQYTDVIPLLVAAIKELKTEFDTYKASHP